MFNALPLLKKDEALKILSSPIEELRLSSDYYKAVTNLLRYPCEETEIALISLLKIKSEKQEIRIAQRKSIEVLARLNSQKAIPHIIEFLNDKDKYMVENAVWALQELNVKSKKINNLIANKLEDPVQNRRVIIQALAKLSAIDKLPKIKSILDHSNSSGEYGAAIAAISRLTNKNYRFEELEKLLYSHNQNERQNAIQDVIDAKAISLILPVIKTPVSPFFKIRALDLLWPLDKTYHKGMNILEIIDKVIKDHPNDINQIEKKDKYIDLEELIDKLFHPDFDKAYISLRKIISFKPDKIWLALYNKLEAFQKDYGALYFLLKLFYLVPRWPEHSIPRILEITYRAIDGPWPNFMKFRPAAILLLIKYKSVRSKYYIRRYFDFDKTPYWACRYACLMAIDLYENNSEYIVNIQNMKSDSNRFVSFKAENILNSIIN